MFEKINIESIDCVEKKFLEQLNGPLEAEVTVGRPEGLSWTEIAIYLTELFTSRLKWTLGGPDANGYSYLLDGSSEPWVDPMQMVPLILPTMIREWQCRVHLDKMYNSLLYQKVAC